MSERSLAKSHDEFLLDLIDQYRREFGAFRAEEVTDWIRKNHLLPDPTVDPRRLLTKKIKQAMRRKHIRDAQQRKVRKFIAVKIERLTAGGQRIIDVVWDHLHEMSLDHALTAFQQCDDIITKQRLAATRNLESCLDNNPHVAGYERQFTFGFMLEHRVPQVVEEVSESAIVPLGVPAEADESENERHPLSSQKPR